jgi:hypothetical protein
MPQSRKRKHHHDHHAPANAEKSKKNRSAIPAAVIFFTLVGAGIAFFAAGSDLLWLLLGAVAGAAGGYLFGRQVDNSFSKK